MEKRSRFNVKGRGKEVKNLKDYFTLVITIHERKHTLETIQKHYSDAPFNIIYSDSSREKTNLYLREGDTYLYFKNELYYKKMKKTLDLVNTPFVAEICDDMLLNLQSVVECVDFLDKNKDYVVCDGLYSEKYKNISNRILNIDQNNLSKLQRVEFFTRVNIWHALNHAVVRTKTLKTIYNFVANDPNLYPIRMFDKIWSYISFFEGRHKKLNIRYCDYVPTVRILNDARIKYPTLLQKNLLFSQIRKDQQKLLSLSKFLTLYGYGDEESFLFTQNLFRKNFE